LPNTRQWFDKAVHLASRHVNCLDHAISIWGIVIDDGFFTT
jgi:hypothetical protein